MRLTTLARKIDKTPNQMIAFLNDKGIDTSGGLHSKLQDDTVEMVLNHFLTDQKREEIFNTVADEIIVDEIIEIVEEDVISVKTTESLPAVEKSEEIDNVDTQPIPEPSEIAEVFFPDAEKTIELEKIGTLDDLENENSEEIELIKVKKVKLEGIKVVGKIELQEKPKEGLEEVLESESKDDDAGVEEKAKKPLKSNGEKVDRRKKSSPHKKSLLPNYEERLKNEEREKLKLRRRRENRERERKKRYYLKNIQPKTVQKPKSLKKSTSSAQSNSEQVRAHKNPFQRLWAWLNGKYDRY